MKISFYSRNNAPIIFSFLLISTILFAGCLSTFGIKKDLNEAQQRIQILNSELEERNRQLTTAIVDLSDHKQEKALAEDYPAIDELINMFAKENQRIIGLPIERVDILNLLERFKIDRETLISELNKHKEQHTIWLKERRQLNDSISVLTEQLKHEKNRSIFSRIFGWFGGLGASTTILIFLGLFLAPTVTIPILGKIFSWFVSLVPQIINFFGVVGKQSFDEIVTGIQRAKEKVRKDPEDKVYTKQDIQELIERELSIATAEATKKVISHRKTALHLK